MRIVKAVEIIGFVVVLVWMWVQIGKETNVAVEWKGELKCMRKWEKWKDIALTVGFGVVWNGKWMMRWGVV